MADVLDLLRELKYGKTVGEKELVEQFLATGITRSSALNDDAGRIYVVCGYKIGSTDDTASPVQAGDRPYDDSALFQMTGNAYTLASYREDA